MNVKMIEMLKTVIASQDPKGVENDDWYGLKIRETHNEDGSVDVALDSVCVGFHFNADGSFAGVYNWYEG